MSGSFVVPHILLRPISDQGVLQVQLLNGGEIHGADRGGMFFPSRTPSILTHIVALGKSDPYVVFNLDGVRVFKSQTKKRTVEPEWNETFAVSIVSVTHEYWEPLFSDYDHFSLLVLGETSKLRSMTGTRSRMPRSWEAPGSTLKKLSPSAVWRRPSV